jgi:raffinose/stachyose/melibiose transport system permease protein
MSENSMVTVGRRTNAVAGYRFQKKLGAAIKLAVLSILLVLFLAPFLMVLINSFKPDAEIILDPLRLPTSLRFQNFTVAFEKMHFLNALYNSFIITVASVVFIALFSSMCAYALVRRKSRGHTAIYLAMVASMIVPFQAIMIPLLKIYGSIGMLNSAWSLVYMYIGFGTSFAVFMYHGFIKGISLELEEAATIDGCSTIEVFFLIVLPLLQSTTMTVIILDVLWIWNDFLLPSLVLLAPLKRTLPLSTFYFYGTYTVNYGLLLAGLVMTIIPVVVFYLFSQRYIISGITAGSIK